MLGSNTTVGIELSLSRDSIQNWARSLLLWITVGTKPEAHPRGPPGVGMHGVALGRLLLGSRLACKLQVARLLVPGLAEGASG